MEVAMKEFLAQYLRENLSVYLDIHDTYDGKVIRVDILLEGETIAHHKDYLPEECKC